MELFNVVDFGRFFQAQTSQEVLKVSRALVPHMYSQPSPAVHGCSKLRLRPRIFEHCAG